MLRCREQDEVQPPSNPKKLQRCFIKINCSKCGQEGYNATTCERRQQGNRAQGNGEGDLRGQTSANPSKQQSRTNGRNSTSETSANQAHFVPRGIQSTRNIFESNAQVSNPSSSSIRVSTMKTNTKSYAKKNNIWKP
ncbi:unnamed protein product [Prunus armeniaca]|uniref:Uncharacterized protein n=1 Tax=Prunus armeniaca TaxID=36596 RepID=A0A6J5XDS9_PRUAR|nr:unnamed protein product [Prunus armeniaca]CAB4309028.1 unnamed protein product [Prunus armeniaca]